MIVLHHSCSDLAKPYLSFMHDISITLVISLRECFLVKNQLRSDFWRSQTLQNAPFERNRRIITRNKRFHMRQTYFPAYCNQWGNVTGGILFVLSLWLLIVFEKCINRQMSILWCALIHTHQFYCNLFDFSIFGKIISILFHSFLCWLLFFVSFIARSVWLIAVLIFITIASKLHLMTKFSVAHSCLYFRCIYAQDGNRL